MLVFRLTALGCCKLKVRDMNKLLIAVLAFSFIGSSNASTSIGSNAVEATNISGLNYSSNFEVLLNPVAIKSNKVLIEEFFSYNCGSCYNQSKIVKQVVEKWGDKVEHVVVPLRGKHNPGSSAGLFYSLEKAGAKNTAHVELLYQGAKTPETPLTISEINSIIQSSNVNLHKFNGMYSSVDVAKKDIAAKALQTRYQINQESAVVINGRYLVKGDHNKLAIVLNQMISKEHERVSKKTH